MQVNLPDFLISKDYIQIEGSEDLTFLMLRRLIHNLVGICGAYSDSSPFLNIPLLVLVFLILLYTVSLRASS